MSLATSSIRFEDSALVEQMRQGDMQAFARMVAKYQDKIYNTCRRICGDVDDANDVTQEVFLKVLESIGTFKGKSSFYTWLFRIAVNMSLTHRRQAKRHFAVPLTPVNDGRVGGQAARLSEKLHSARVGNPAEQADIAETRRLVAEALDDLEDGFRAVVVLKDIEGFDYAQIAEILEVPIGTVRSRLFRARMALRQALRDVLAEVA